MLPSRWSPAYHRVLQCFFPCLCRRLEERTGPPTRQPGRHQIGVRDRSRRHLGQGDRGGPGECAERTERRRHPRVRPVQQPGHHQSGGRVRRGHRRSGVMPGVAVPGGGHVPRMHGVPGTGGHRGVVVRVGQCEVQRPLRRQREPDGRHRGVAPPCERPDRRELRHDRHGHQSPGHRAFVDGVVAEGREHGAEHGEQTGPRARSRVAGPACCGTSLVPCHVIRLHGRPSSPNDRAPYARPSTTPVSRRHDRVTSDSVGWPFVLDVSAGGGQGRSPRRIRRGGQGRSDGRNVPARGSGRAAAGPGRGDAQGRG